MVFRLCSSLLSYRLNKLMRHVLKYVRCCLHAKTELTGKPSTPGDCLSRSPALPASKLGLVHHFPIQNHLFSCPFPHLWLPSASVLGWGEILENTQCSCSCSLWSDLCAVPEGTGDVCIGPNVISARTTYGSAGMLLVCEGAAPDAFSVLLLTVGVILHSMISRCWLALCWCRGLTSLPAFVGPPTPLPSIPQPQEWQLFTMGCCSETRRMVICEGFFYIKLGNV